VGADATCLGDFAPGAALMRGSRMLITTAVLAAIQVALFVSGLNTIPLPNGLNVTFLSIPAILAGVLAGPIDLFKNPVWEVFRDQAVRKGAEMRSQGFFNPAMLGMEELEYGGIMERLKALDRRFELMRSLGLDARRLTPTAAREIEPGLAPAVAGAVPAVLGAVIFWSLAGGSITHATASGFWFAAAILFLGMFVATSKTLWSRTSIAVPDGGMFQSAAGGVLRSAEMRDPISE